MARNLLGASVLLSSLVLVSACGSNAADNAAPTTTQATTAGTESPAATQSAENETSQYTRIVAVSTETANMALSLVDPENFAAVAESAKAPGMGEFPELARRVEGTVPQSTNPDPEQILAMQPDLVLLTSRHGGEKTLADQLEAAGVETLNFSSSDFETPEAFAASLRTLADTLGVSAKGERLASDFEAKIAELDAKRNPAANPSMVALMSRGPAVMAMDAENTLPGLALRAGATDAAGAAGITSTGPIDAELLALANPDIIFVEDFMGRGLEPFAALLENPAVAEVPAVANSRIVLMPMNEASAIAGENMAVGYEKILDEVNK
ncbi:ABC transporter substrate-binding protein [Corynebacterium sp.]|uniref:ABC transporter substrate-binding protein n=1 Tax=Corynebacterium sp. TaxID=1720 RepID=UPI002A91B49E|nr:ABC transporter substrate-binding protein [Corynebacterium sp.]MDY5786224.1 ABC transporter substrate-binding protein [Corynebacterium sp.]